MDVRSDTAFLIEEVVLVIPGGGNRAPAAQVDNPLQVGLRPEVRQHHSDPPGHAAGIVADAQRFPSDFDEEVL